MLPFNVPPLLVITVAWLLGVLVVGVTGFVRLTMVRVLASYAAVMLLTIVFATLYTDQFVAFFRMLHLTH